MGKGSERRPLGKADRAEANRLYGEGYERIHRKKKGKKQGNAGMLGKLGKQENG